jgi:hypothetical protein
MTSGHEIPNDVQQLLHEHVESYEQLEILLLFAGEPDRSWSGRELAAKAGMPIGAAVDAAEHLHQVAVLIRSESGGVARFSARSDLTATIDHLHEAHQRDRLGIMNLMTAFALERVRTSALRAFAGAFQLGKKHDG